MYRPAGKNNLKVLDLVTAPTALSSEESVASSSQESSNTNSAGTTTSNSDSMGFKSCIDASPPDARLDLCKAVDLVIGGLVHETKVNRYSIVDIVGAGPGGVTTASSSKCASWVSTQDLDGGSHLRGRDRLDDALWLQLSTDRPVGIRPVLVLLIILHVDVSQVSIFQGCTLLNSVSGTVTLTHCDGKVVV